MEECFRISMLYAFLAMLPAIHTLLTGDTLSWYLILTLVVGVVYIYLKLFNISISDLNGFLFRNHRVMAVLNYPKYSKDYELIRQEVYDALKLINARAELNYLEDKYNNIMHLVELRSKAEGCASKVQLNALDVAIEKEAAYLNSNKTREANELIAAELVMQKELFNR